MTYRAIYRCKLCGRTFHNGKTTNDKDLAYDALEELHAGICGTVPARPRETETHRCEGGRLGYAYFLGYDIEEAQP